jgi:hypothetical protein
VQHCAAAESRADCPRILQLERTAYELERTNCRRGPNILLQRPSRSILVHINLLRQPVDGSSVLGSAILTIPLTKAVG